MPRGVSLYDEAQLQGRLWTPRLLLNKACVAFYSTRDLSTIQQTGTNSISLVKDQSGNGRDLTPTAGASIIFNAATREIIFTSSGGGTLNTAANVPSSVTGASPRMLYGVGRRYSTTQDSNLAFYGAENSLNAFGLALNVPIQSNKVAVYDYSGDLVLGNSIDDLTLLGAKYDGATFSGILNVSTVVSASRSESTVASVLRLGGRVTKSGPAAIKNCCLASSVDPGDEAKLQGFLAWDADRPSILPASHKFANRPPLIGD